MPSLTSPVAIATLLVAAAAAALMVPITIPGRTARLLRALLPSWKFFDDVGPEYDLWVRETNDGQNGAWHPVLERPRRHAGMVLWNPDTNLHLAHRSLVQQLVNEIADLPEPSSHAVGELVAFALVRRLSEASVRARGIAGHYQLRIACASEGGVDHDGDVLLSPPYEVPP